MKRKSEKVRVVECYDVPEKIDKSVIYKFLPKNFDQEYYNERTDRNIGWITRQEQSALYKKTIN